MTGFLNHPAVQLWVSASTQNQALCALVFLYRRVLGLDQAMSVDPSAWVRPDHRHCPVASIAALAISCNPRGVPFSRSGASRFSRSAGCTCPSAASAAVPRR